MASHIRAAMVRLFLKAVRRALARPLHERHPELPAKVNTSPEPQASLRRIRVAGTLAVATAAQRAQHAERLKGLAIFEGAPEIAVHPRATIVRARSGGAAVKHHGGVFDEDGQFIKASEIVRGASATRIVGAVDGAQPKARTHVRGAAIYGGFAFRHFGHLLVESLNRVWMSSLPAGRTPIYVQTLGKELSPVAAQLFELAGIRSLVRVVRHDTSFDSVILPESAFVHRVQAHTVFKQLYMRMTDRALGRKRPSVTQQPLYLSRTGLSELQRTTAGEAVLEEALASSGFRIVHPERLALEEQIRLVNEHQVIVGSIGSAFHLLLFSRLENEAVYFSCGLPGLSFALCDALNGTRAHYLLTAHRDPPPKEPWVKAWNYPDWLDVNATLAALHDLGMIPKMTVDDAKLGPIEDEYRRRLAAKLRADEKRGEQREG